MKNQKGVSLFEVLIILALLSAVVTLATPPVLSLFEKGIVTNHVTNARLIEDAAGVYFRIHGELPIVQNEDIKVKDVDHESWSVIYQELEKAGIVNPSMVLNEMTNNMSPEYVVPVFKKINYPLLKEHLKQNFNGEGVENLLIVDVGLPTYSLYDDDLMGYVFATNHKIDANDHVVSGGYSSSDKKYLLVNNMVYNNVNKTTNIQLKSMGKGYIKDESTCTPVMAGEIKSYTKPELSINVFEFHQKSSCTDLLDKTVVPAINTGAELIPRNFRVTNVAFVNGRALTTLSWDKQFCKTNEAICTKSTDVIRGMRSNDYELTVVINGIPQTHSTNENKITLDLPLTDDATFRIRGTSVTYGSNNVGPSRQSVIQTTLKSEIGEGEILIVNNGLEEITGGSFYTVRNSAYKVYTEKNLLAGNVNPIFNGIQIANVAVGDIIVLKELKKQGSLYLLNKNKTKIFRVRQGSSVEIPKNPYLQLEFQTNNQSDVVYILERYTDVFCNCQSKQNPDAAVQLYY